MKENLNFRTRGLKWKERNLKLRLRFNSIEINNSRTIEHKKSLNIKFLVVCFVSILIIAIIFLLRNRAFFLHNPFQIFFSVALLLFWWDWNFEISFCFYVNITSALEECYWYPCKLSAWSAYKYYYIDQVWYLKLNIRYIRFF